MKTTRLRQGIRFLPLLAALSAFPLAAAAQDAPRSDTLARPVMQVLRITEPVVIDGRLNDAVWARATPADNFVQRTPIDGVPATERTEARILIDDRNIYVGIRLYDSRPALIGKQLARRDAGDTFTDWIFVGFDTYGDRRTAFAFGVSPRGAQQDGYLFNDSEFDGQWDAVWQSAANIDSLGWSVEMRIPLSQLRFTAGDSTRNWGVQFLRQIARTGENSNWSPRPANTPADVSRFGVLTGLGALEGAVPLEVIPYLRSQVATLPPDPGNPFHAATAGETAIGVDVRMRLPKSLTLTATVNPDFGQVEADPAVVNLSAFEVFFPERRPFFLESLDNFQFGETRSFNSSDPPNFFYTRRIGRPPQRRLPGEFVDIPTQTPILAALKLSGTTPGGWAVGSLNSTTARGIGRRVLPGGGIVSEEVEPLTNSHVSRVRKLLRGGFSSVGAFGSWVERELSDTLVRSVLPQRALVGGVDFEHAWNERTWTISGVAARSRVSGDAAAMARLQLANYRSFQRPDAAHLAFDPTRESLSGGYYALTGAKTAGRLTGSVTLEQLDPGFEANDLGFQTNSDLRAISTGTFYRQPNQTRFFQSWSLGFFSTLAATTAGDNLERRIATFNEVQFRNFWTLEFSSNLETGRFNDRLLRGGPIAARPNSSRTEISVTTDPRRPLILSVSAENFQNRAGSRAQEYGIGFDWRPQSAIRVRIEPEIAINDIVDQYVTSTDDITATATFGRRYVFADVRQREARLNTRLDWTFSPYVSLQLLLQPFASAGEFLRYKEFLTPREFKFATYGETQGTITRDGSTVTIDPDGAGAAASFAFGERDYTARELRGNAVLRWELRPGSTLFLVWQQTRDSFETGANLDAAGELGALFGEPARNVFLVKFAWWFGR